MRCSCISALFLGLGILGAGYFLGEGIMNHNNAERVASVKGLSEREVPASLGIWSMNIKAQAEGLDQLEQSLNNDVAQVIAYLKSKGFDENEIFVQPPDVTDKHRDADFMTARERAQARAKQAGQDQQEDNAALNALLKIPRYQANQQLVVRSTKINKIKPAMASFVQLLGKGIEISSNSPQFIYERLNDIKPDMIAEATRNSLLAAENFARDTQSQLGGLVRATQGRFNVEDRDEATPEIKVIRVIVDVDYKVK
ncbi:MAG: SIMPL domain-containing protein [Akkermansia sp.]